MDPVRPYWRIPRAKIQDVRAKRIVAAAGTMSVAHDGTSMPSNTRDGYHATKPTGITVSRLTSRPVERPSSGNGESWCISCQVEELTSSAARGDQKASAPHANWKAMTIAM